MINEIVSDPLEPEDLWNDLNANIDWLKNNSVEKVLLLFGFSWGKTVYDKEWENLATPVDQIKKFILELEKSGAGSLGADNMYMTVPDYEVRLQYSYESHIHISYNTNNPFVETILDRWSDQKWLLVHQSKQKHKKRPR